MAVITLRDIDSRLLDELQAAAYRHNSSIETEIVETLKDRFLPDRRADLRKRADAIAAMTPKDVVQTDSTILVREDRDA
jgi:antitoxin FitA